MTERATCWSITINNPQENEMRPELPAGWVLTGQPEVGANGTLHLQMMLTTPQVRFSAVKKVFPRAHIEVARNRSALQNYVVKEDTRAGDVINITSSIPTMWDYQRTVANKWCDDEFQLRYKNAIEENANANAGEAALEYVDSLVAQDVRSGMRGVEFIAINPMWRSSWKKFYAAIVYREKNASQSIACEATQVCTSPACGEVSSSASSASGDANCA